MKGFFQLQRKFFSHWLWEEARAFSKAEAFLDLLQLAAYTRTRKIVGDSVILLEPGQVCGSERYLAGRWGWSTKKVRTFLTLLEADRMVERKTKRSGSILTLCNYERYKSTGSTVEAPEKHGGSTPEAPRKRIEEGEEQKEGGRTETIAPPIPVSHEKALCSLEQALAYAAIARMSEAAAHHWWHTRNASGWTKGSSGGAPRRVTSWQSDMVNSATWAEEAAARAAEGGSSSSSVGEKRRPVPRL